MTGRYNHRNYVRFGLLDRREKTFGHMLRDAGYATCIAGKWQLHGDFNAPRHFGFENYCLWQLTRRGSKLGSRYPNPMLGLAEYWCGTGFAELGRRRQTGLHAGPSRRLRPSPSPDI